MSPSFFLIFAIAVLASPLCTDAHLRCQRHDQCAAGECCSMGQQRFSVPACRKMQQAGEACRPKPIQLTDMVFHYPGGSEIKVDSAILGICPCATGLTCTRGTCEAS